MNKKELHRSLQVELRRMQALVTWARLLSEFAPRARGGEIVCFGMDLEKAGLVSNTTWTSRLRQQRCFKTGCYRSS